MNQVKVISLNDSDVKINRDVNTALDIVCFQALLTPLLAISDIRKWLDAVHAAGRPGADFCKTVIQNSELAAPEPGQLDSMIALLKIAGNFCNVCYKHLSDSRTEPALTEIDDVNRFTVQAMKEFLSNGGSEVDRNVDAIMKWVKEE